MPERGNFAAIEPMTATIDALGRGTAPMVKPGDRFSRLVQHRVPDAVTLRLLPVGAHTGFLGRLCVPDDLYWVSRTPVALAGMSYPGRADWSLLAARGHRPRRVPHARHRAVRRVAVHRHRAHACRTS